MNYLNEMMTMLGNEQHVGHAFAITRHVLEDEYDGDIQKIEWPEVAYPYAVFLDPMTANYLICRQDADGAYATWPNWKQVR